MSLNILLSHSRSFETTNLCRACISPIGIPFVTMSLSRTPLLRELHWLRVPERIQFRLCVLVHHCLNGTAPSYLAETHQKSADVGARQRLRSAATSTLVVPPTRRATLGDRAFSVAAARAWNALPLSVRAVSSLLLFRRELKTTLFRASYA